MADVATTRSSNEEDEGKHRHRHPSEMHSELTEKRSFGEAAADWVSNASGSWKFIIGYIALTFVWVGVNVVSPLHFDNYPFIFYTFSVSVLAILMSSIILLAGNRQAQVDRAHAENSYHQVEDIDTLTTEVHAITVSQRHVASQVAAMCKHLGLDTPTDGGVTG